MSETFDLEVFPEHAPRVLSERMQIQVNTDNNVDGHDGLTLHVRTVVEGALHRFAHQITRVEVHLGDENGDKSGGDDKRCMMEARLAGRQPTAVTHHAPSVHQAIDGAAEKLERALEHALGRLDDR